MSDRKPLIAGNWKMNLNHFEAIALVQKLAFSLDEKQLSDVEVVVLPPFVDIRSVQTVIDGDNLLLGFGAQDVSAHASGAYTGEISAAMLAKLGCTYVTVGHSERRQYHGEDDKLVGAKAKAALANEITPILCVGEPLPVRESGEHVEHSVGQLLAAIEGLSSEQVDKLVVAYEPVWAIGTGKTCAPDDAQEVIGALRAALAKDHPEAAEKVRILYGGSVKAGNVAQIMKKPDIDGALVGGASIDADEFVKICRFPEHNNV
ncbi:triose-phosphate isomerase [Stackebrandtia nassauensis]|uniref:Triosephosphate isomerase n=1 Tax=Stackebrandtia nassauensis (strain DSM 44728 / CIP 108903 / NRRL B-16338 / NBRC 102104 / LLR-40K-21) TaxID=446470 RepID=D3Q9H3_STANL|nr:triose-phosphate isomerase [Stackebrandtia nassauensis]ADD42655.1 triosephosphate isomerase [Stackebrandtia nassauensis DSM 44728]